MAETVVKKKKCCQCQCNEFQHITLLKTNNKDQFLFMSLFSPTANRLLEHIQDIVTTFAHGLSAATAQRNRCHRIRYKILRHCSLAGAQQKRPDMSEAL